ncbi:DUF2269 domain-containing protein [Commensalibacter oyaizuii]|uniref:DUF2269 domain-containing protein n=1 Tax=Commensalibacter oyaizuii TaxID=3043873 RepID=A0ABT6Q2A8_9PROT|nr:DUF2269 domain-containing protein [Commensalibacter sp. TBRC 16381]MDI2091246.1 DUF2269 domain-containing protein [Commensalibacter sp. TBRC 16381]
MSWFNILLCFHIFSATILFASGIITAIVMVEAFIRRHPHDMAHSAQRVVKADWYMTLPCSIIQSITGIWLVHLMGIPFSTCWVLWAIILYSISMILWVIVVQLQIHIASLTQRCWNNKTPLSPVVWKYFWWWVALGWPTLLCFMAIFWLMVARPVSL